MTKVTEGKVNKLLELNRKWKGLINLTECHPFETAWLLLNMDETVAGKSDILLRKDNDKATLKCYFHKIIWSFDVWEILNACIILTTFQSAVISRSFSQKLYVLKLSEEWQITKI